MSNLLPPWWFAVWTSVLAAGLWAATLNAALAQTTTTELRLAVEADYPPFVFEDGQGTAQGLSIDLLALVLPQAGLRVRPLPARALKDWLPAMRQGEADLITSLRPTPERADFLAFTRPYIKVPAILVTGPGRDPAHDAQGLAGMQDQPVAVGSGYAVEAPMRKTYPLVRWQGVPNDTEGLRGVIAGRYAGAVLDAASAAHVIESLQMQGLRNAGRVGFEYELSFAVPKERQDWLRALDNGIRHIDPVQRQAILDRWLRPLQASPMDRRGFTALWLALALLLAGLGMLGRVLWHRRRSTPAHD